MDLSNLRGYLQKLVAVNAKSKPMSIDLALGLIGAYMLQNAVNIISDWDTMKTFLSYLRRECFNGKKKAIISGSSFSDCVLYIQHHLSDMPFEKKKGILMSFGLKVITGMEEDGHLTFNNITFPAYASQTIINGKRAQDYIVDSIVDDKVVTQYEPTKVVEKETSDTDENFVAEKKQRIPNVCTENSPFIQLYDELVKVDPDNRTKAKYTWQWLLSLDEYNAIKECVGKNKIPSPKKWDSKTARLLALYIGEYHKREYEKNINPFAQFGDDSPNVEFDDFKNVCSFLNIEPYKKVKDTHKFTICVSGGLPVHNISSKLDNDKSNSFIDGLSKLLDPEDDIEIMVGEDLLEKGSNSNTATRESYHNRHSIYEYIHALKEDEKTWNDSDNDNKEFREFKEKIKEASKKANERKKFKLFYSLWTFFDETGLKEFNLLPQLRFNPEEDGERHYAISKQRLENWGINNPPAQFSLKIGDTSLIFTICYNGDYISRGLVDRIDLPMLDENLKIEDLSNPDYTIIYDDLTNEPCSLKKDFYFPFKDGYMQLYTDDDPSMASWNSYKGAQAFMWSGVLYDKNRYQLLSQNTIININDQIGWVTFADSVTFKDTNKGKHRTLFNSRGKIYAYPATQCMHEEITKSSCLVEGCISLDGQVDCAIGNEQGKAYIVKSNGITFDVFRAADDEKVAVSPVVVYKSASSYKKSSAQWQEYDSKKTKLDQGLYVFRLSLGHYMTEVNCYVLPEEANISFFNTSEPYLIKFNKFTGVTSAERLVNSQTSESIVFRISRDSNNKDKYTFTLGDEDGHITLHTYHPKAQTHLFFHGQEITDKPIIMAYAEDIEVNYISSQCSNKPKCRLSDYTEAYKRLFGALTATLTDKNNNVGLLSRGFDILLDKNDPKSTIRIRVYTQDFQSNNCCSDNMMLLDLISNQLIQYNPDNIKNIAHDSLLLHSLKDDRYTGAYYAPKFISKDGKKASNNVKVEERQNRLQIYADRNEFVSDYAYQQFEIACEHKTYFAVFDALLCLCWNSKKHIYLDRNEKNFKDNLQAFLKGYIAYSKEPCIAGLRRLARELLFDWKTIKSSIGHSNSQQLKELYQEIINN